MAATLPAFTPARMRSSSPDRGASGGAAAMSSCTSSERAGRRLAQDRRAARQPAAEHGAGSLTGYAPLPYAEAAKVMA